MPFKPKLPEDKYTERFEFTLTPPVADKFRKDVMSTGKSTTKWLREFIEKLVDPVPTGNDDQIEES